MSLLVVGAGCGDDDPTACDDSVAVPQVAGTWTQEQIDLSSTTCAAEVASALTEAVPLSCDNQVSQSGCVLTGFSCDGTAFEGHITAEGQATLVSESSIVVPEVPGCTITVTQTTTTTYTDGSSVPAASAFDVRFSGTCFALADPCEGVITSQVRFVE